MPLPPGLHIAALIGVGIGLGALTLVLLIYWAGMPQFYGGPVLLCLISAAYFIASRNNGSWTTRLLTSVHGLVAAVIAAAALVLWMLHKSNRSYGTFYWIFFLIPFALVVASLLRYPGPKIVHVLQGPNIVAMLWSAFIGGMAVTGEWL